MRGSLCILFCLVLSVGSAEEAPTVATFSIVAVDSETGEIGVAVQSRIVGVGSVVPFAKAGVGAIATQAYANVGYGPLGLMALEAEMPPDEVIELLTKDDPLRRMRQVAVISSTGDSATFTGRECMDWAGGITGDNFAVQGNILTGPEVVEAMASVFQETDGVLAERLIAALHAGQEAGGDSRGRQSAALLVVREGWGYGGLSDRFRDIRVDEHETPIIELERVYRKHRELFRRPE